MKLRCCSSLQRWKGEAKSVLLESSWMGKIKFSNERERKAKDFLRIFHCRILLLAVRKARTTRMMLMMTRGRTKK
jgi:hypothetical protein